VSSVTSSGYKAKLDENRRNHSSINMDFIRLVTWPMVTGYEEKDIKAQKLFVGLRDLIRSSTNIANNQGPFFLISFPSSYFFFFPFFPFL